MRGVSALALSLTACAYQITGYSEQPKTTRVATADQVSVSVHWVDDVDELKHHCNAVPGLLIEACAWPKNGNCTIYAMQPKDFNDKPKLAILGHELWHCLGAEHARN